MFRIEVEIALEHGYARGIAVGSGDRGMDVRFLRGAGGCSRAASCSCTTAASRPSAWSRSPERCSTAWQRAACRQCGWTGSSTANSGRRRRSTRLTTQQAFLRSDP